MKYIKGFAFEIRTSFPQDLAVPKQAYVRNMQMVVSYEQRDYREPFISHAELVGAEGFTFVPEFSSVKPPKHAVSMWHHVLGVHSDRIPWDAPRSYLPPRVEYVGFARDLEQAFNLLACSLRAPDGTGRVSFDHLVRSELTSAAWETLVIHTERLAGSSQGEYAEGWHRLLEYGPTFLFIVLRLSVGPDGHFMSVLLGVFHTLSSQRVTFGIQGLFGTGKIYCASAALILLTRMLGLRALFVAEPNLFLQEFSRNVQSVSAPAWACP